MRTGISYAQAGSQVRVALHIAGRYIRTNVVLQENINAGLYNISVLFTEGIVEPARFLKGDEACKALIGGLLSPL